MSALQVTARFRIHPGKTDEFKDLAARCLVSTREKDTGTLQYDWFMNGDETECVVRETYRDSDAVLEHAANLGPLMGEFFELSDPDLEIFGRPTDQLVEALSTVPVRYYSPLQSL